MPDRPFSLPVPPAPRRSSLARAARLGLAALAASTLACSKTYIPNTEVEDTSDNRKIVLFCEQYRHALEEKNVSALVKMMSSSYFEDGGNTKAEDDIDYAGVKEFLTGDFLKTTGIRYEIRYRRVTFTEQKHVWVDYTFWAAYRIPGVKSEEWHHKVGDNRLDLVAEGDTYKIAAGM
jgi:hypothetical protein